jgi:membrane-associated protease RseP (regulator of RpoE activity)
MAAMVVVAMAATLFGGWLFLLVPGVFVHEAGHWIVGRRLGYRLYRFAIWPFVWDLAPKKGFRFDGRSSNYPGLGYVVMFPDTWPCGNRGQVMFLLGGPIANLAMALVCVGLAQVWSWWYLATIGPAFLLFSSIVSLTSKEAKNQDLPRVVQWVKQPSEQSALWAAQKLIFLLANGGSPSEADWQEAFQLKENPRLRLWLYLNGVTHSIGSEREARFQRFEELLRDPDISEPDFSEHKWRF